jgi:cell cycle serine/threonine-protein kinase CDC5/MSD2
LTPDPQLRPTLHEILDHPFFTHGPVPPYIPSSAHDAPPDFRHISRSASLNNLKRLRRQSLLDEDQVTSIAIAKAADDVNLAATVGLAKSMTSSIAQQEKEFQRAVQPGSPISALLSSARQPLLMGPNGNANGARESPLLRKLQAVRESPLGRRPMKGLNRISEDAVDEEARIRTKELEAQKARIVAQMAPVQEEDEDPERELEKETVRVRAKTADRENVPPVPAANAARVREREREKEREHRIAGKERERAVPGMTIRCARCASCPDHRSSYF